MWRALVTIATFSVLSGSLAGCPGGKDGDNGSGGSPTASTAPATTAPEPPAVTSAKLIASAESAHQITHAEAVEYRVFAAYADSRLPAAYQATTSGLNLTQVSAEAAAAFADSNVPASIRANIGPYLVPPSYTESWHTTKKAAPGRPTQSS